MAVRKRVRPQKGATSRVHRITSMEQWENMLQRAGDRVVVVQFLQASNMLCKQMKPYFARFSSMPQFRKAVFAEVEVDSVEEVAHANSIVHIPAFHAYVRGELVEKVAGGQPQRVQEMIATVLREHSSGGGVLASVAKGLLVAGAVAAGVLAYLRLTRGGGGGGGGGGEDRSALLEVKQRIALAQDKLRRLEKAHRSKAARATRKALAQLEVRKAALERAAGAGQPRAADRGAAAAAAATAKQRPAAAAAGGGGEDSDGGEGVAYYSDEEAEAQGQAYSDGGEDDY